VSIDWSSSTDPSVRRTAAVSGTALGPELL
jgi:hypothetical protein